MCVTPIGYTCLAHRGERRRAAGGAEWNASTLRHLAEPIAQYVGDEDASAGGLTFGPARSGVQKRDRRESIPGKRQRLAIHR